MVGEDRSSNLSEVADFKLQKYAHVCFLTTISDIILLVGEYSVLGNFSGRKHFSKNLALIVQEGRIRLEVDKSS